MSELGNIKGAAFREFLLWYEKRFDSASICRALSTLEAKHGESFEPSRPAFGVLPSHWYPAEVVHDLLDQLMLGRSEPELAALAQEAATFIMERTLRGIYRTMFQLLATPERYAKHVPKLWAQHYDTGLVIVDVVKGACEHRIRYERWTSHHPFICRLNMSSAIPIYGAMGCKDVRWTRVGCVAAGAEVCQSRVRWRQ